METRVPTAYRMYLQFSNGPLAQQRYEIPLSLSISIGSSLSDTIRIPTLQPGHAHIWQDHEHLMIGVSNVANYLAINQKRTHRAELHDGDTITLGDFGVMCQLQVVYQPVRKPVRENDPPVDTVIGKGQLSRVMLKHATHTSQPVVVPALEEQPQTCNEATRYLCMAVYSDENFCNYVNNNILNEDIRTFGDTSGLDVHAIARWTLAARRRFVLRDIALVTAFVLGLWLIGPGLAIFGLLSYLLPFILCWLILIVERCWCYYGPEVGKLRRSNFTPGVGGVALPTSVEWNLNMGLPQKPGNVVVYSGFSPFVGAGVNVKNWSFVIDITKGKDLLGKKAHPKSFTLSELYNTLASDMKKLNLTGLTVEDKLYVDGKEIGERREFLPNPFAHPVTWLDDTILLKYKDRTTPDQAGASERADDEHIRYYQCYKVDFWQGDLVLSFFLRFHRIGNNLLVEGNDYLLPPIDERYREIDEMRTRFDLRWLFKLLLRTAVPSSLTMILLTPYRLVGHLLKDWLLARRRRTQTEIEHKPTFDYGATTSLREIASSATYQRHFQRLDQEYYLKLIEYQLLVSLTAFMDAHTIDSTQLRERQQAIFNAGIIFS
ncbi:hypothetical protein [Dictyobacter kobayashii]|uniref:FHA domain-containing protein n=1 Tax=Dictyobacter kobayashii TaxID=2014872 RepID=A0A402AUW3_9CHLR|nr:hypothetical protein [Dictyobacter kobayashii]GCE22911.1 hypothetical protein KDK_67110 [Dictyobacter kobayashii]